MRNIILTLAVVAAVLFAGPMAAGVEAQAPVLDPCVVFTSIEPPVEGFRSGSSGSSIRTSAPCRLTSVPGQDLKFDVRYWYTDERKVSKLGRPSDSREVTLALGLLTAEEITYAGQQNAEGEREIAKDDEFLIFGNHTDPSRGVRRTPIRLFGHIVVRRAAVPGASGAAALGLAQGRSSRHRASSRSTIA